MNESFALEGVLAFDEPHPEMPRGRVTLPECTAEFYLQGAHLTQWQPAGQAPVLFLSERSEFRRGKAIRGGVPIIFPWFGAPASSPVRPPAGSASHGYARSGSWTLRFAAVAGDNLHLALTLDQDLSVPAAAAFAPLQLGLEMILGASLTLRLTAIHTGEADAQPLLFEEALHTYLQVGDIEEVTVKGLGSTEYLDKTDEFRRKLQSDPDLRFTAETDRPYLNTIAPVTLVDPVLRRRLVVTKERSQTTVVWNPAAALTATLSDLLPDAWTAFACIETANVAENAVTLAAGEAHTMTMHLAVEAL